MVRARLRSKSITTKLTAEEYARLETLAGASGRTMSEWVREKLLEQAKRNEATPGEEIILAELLGLRTVLLNLLAPMGRGEAVTTEQTRLVIGQADAKKWERTRKLLAMPRPGVAVPTSEEAEVQA